MVVFVDREDLEIKLKKSARSANSYKGKLDKAKKSLVEVQRTCTKLEKEVKKLKALPKPPKLWALKCCVCLSLFSCHVVFVLLGRASLTPEEGQPTDRRSGQEGVHLPEACVHGEGHRPHRAWDGAGGSRYPGEDLQGGHPRVRRAGAVSPNSWWNKKKGRTNFK